MLPLRRLRLRERRRHYENTSQKNLRTQCRRLRVMRQRMHIIAIITYDNTLHAASCRRAFRRQICRRAAVIFRRRSRHFFIDAIEDNIVTLRRILRFSPLTYFSC